MELGEICRTCLRRGQPVLPLFDASQESFAGGIPLVEFVNMFTEIMILRNESFPQQICTSCVNDAKRAYAFKLRCECSETTLYKLAETNDIVNLDNFNLNFAYFKSSEQMKDEHPIRDSNTTMDTASDDCIEITNSVMDLLQIETQIDEVLDSDLQAELDFLLQQQVHVKNEFQSLDYESSRDDREIGNEVENGNILTCSACPETFRTRDLLKSHVVDYHTDGKVCILCNREFDCIWTHSENHLFPRLHCAHCDQKFEYRALLNAHLRTHMIKNEETGRLEFKCERCSKNFTSHHEYTTHKRTHTEDRPFSCETCGMAFKRRDKLKAHMTSHSDERPFECSLCQSRFKRKDNLASHMKSVHQQGDKEFKCLICDKAFRFKDKLKAHMNTHLRLFSCEMCHAGFPRKENLDRHIEQKHRFDELSSPVSRTVDNVSNQIVETETKSFACSVCKKEFSLQETLNNHMKTHVKKVELKCDICSKVFGQSNKLKSHMITHTDLRPFQCTYCPSVFKRKDNLNRHMKKHTRTKIVGAATNQCDIARKIPHANCSRPSDENCDSEMSSTIGISQLSWCNQMDSSRKGTSVDFSSTESLRIDDVQNHIRIDIENDIANTSSPNNNSQEGFETKDLARNENISIADKYLTNLTNHRAEASVHSATTTGTNNSESIEPPDTSNCLTDSNSICKPQTNNTHKELPNNFNNTRETRNIKYNLRGCTNSSDSYTIASLLGRNEKRTRNHKNNSNSATTQHSDNSDNSNEIETSRQEAVGSSPASSFNDVADIKNHSETDCMDKVVANNPKKLILTGDHYSTIDPDAPISDTFSENVSELSMTTNKQIELV